MTDRELLEAAARAAGYKLHVWGSKWQENFARMDLPGNPLWNPLQDDGDALRLAVKLQLEIIPRHDRVYVDTASQERPHCFELFNNDPYEQTRRAIVRAAAAMDKGE